MKTLILFLSLIVSFTLLAQKPGTGIKRSPDARLKQACVYKDAEQFDKALREVNQLIGLDSTVAEFFDFRGEVNYHLQEIQASVEDFSKAISLAPTDPLYYHHRSMVLYATQNPDLAIDDNNMALKFLGAKDSMRYSILLNRGSAFVMKRDFQHAYEDFKKVLDFDSTNLGALTNLGAVLDDLGRGDEAVAVLEKVIRLYPNFSGGYGNLAFRYIDKGDFKKALELNNKVVEMDSADPLGYNNRGYVKYKLNDLKGALEDINHSLELYPQNSFAYKNRALVYLAQNENAKACADLNTAIIYGYTEMYGSEVEDLKKKNCKASPHPSPKERG